MRGTSFVGARGYVAPSAPRPGATWLRRAGTPPTLVRRGFAEMDTVDLVETVGEPLERYADTPTAAYLALPARAGVLDFLSQD